MSNIEDVKVQAIEASKKLNDFFRDFSTEDELDFRASFHLRPTSSGDTTIVSTLKKAPMRGLQKINNNSLIEKLEKLRSALPKLHAATDEKTNEILADIGFKNRGRENKREEDAQAAFIRDLILCPENYDDMKFIASEFVLFDFDGVGSTKKPDVLAYKAGTLYDIELKNDRIAPGGKKVSAITQAEVYSKFIHKYLDEYAACLAKFPNNRIGNINNVRGIAYVPKAKGKSRNILETASKDKGIELWEFDDEFRLRHKYPL